VTPATIVGGAAVADSLSPYQVLGVDQDADQQAIRRAYQAALRARAHSRQQVTQAFNQLRSPQSRLAFDLLEPPYTDADGVREALGALPGPHAAPAAVPLPEWTALVVPGVDEQVTPWRQIPPPRAEFTAEGVDGPSAAVLPPIEFPV
jgi:hypothetical protein